jgi:Fic family protein
MQRYLHQVDRDASGALHAPDQIRDADTSDTYLFQSLVEEAITSSQLEGAATTRAVAKDMLQRGRPPVTVSERMIWNNYQAMLYIRSVRGKRLTPTIVFELHRVLMDQLPDGPRPLSPSPHTRRGGTLPEDRVSAGRFRRADEPIVVEDHAGTVLHVPPAASELPDRLDRLCAFANGHEDGPFLHPVVRAILLHFALAYDHPFVDGNGRVARALFYWSMAARGYWLCEYVSISRILRTAPARYAASFLYTETDDNDATYFILHQLRVLERAVADLHTFLKRKAKGLKATEQFLERSAAAREQFNHRQIALLGHAMKHADFPYTIESHRRSHVVAYDTARHDLQHLARAKLLIARKEGRKLVYVAPADLRERIERMRRTRTR